MTQTTRDHLNDKKMLSQEVVSSQSVQPPHFEVTPQHTSNTHAAENKCNFKVRAVFSLLFFFYDSLEFVCYQILIQQLMTMPDMFSKTKFNAIR